jgi:hypothetical protein
MGDHPKKISRGPLLGKLSEQGFLPILPKKDVGFPPTYIWVSCWSCS